MGLEPANIQEKKNVFHACISTPNDKYMWNVKNHYETYIEA